MLRRDPGQSVSFRDSSNRGGLFSSRGPIFLATMVTMMLVGAPQLAFGQTPAITVSPDSVEITETDAEATGTYTVRLATEPSATVTVRISPPSSGDVRVNPTTLEFTTENYDATQDVTVTVTPDDDAITDPVVTFRHTASGGNYGGVTRDVTVTVEEDDERDVTLTVADPFTVMEGESESYKVKLDSEPSGPVTIRVQGASGDVSVDKRILTFTTANWNRDQEVTVSVAHDDDAVDDPDVTLTHAVSGADYDTGVDEPSVTVMITDDDEPALMVTPMQLAIPEGSSRDYRVRLATQPTGEVAVTVDSTSTEVTPNPSSLTFTTANWNRTQTVRVSVAEDPDAADEDPVTLTNSADGADYGGAPDVEVMVTSTDNDTPAVRVSPTSLTVPEGFERDYTVVLATEPSAGVTVTVSGASGDVRVNNDPSSTSLSFTTGDWDEAQTVTVSAVEDDDAATDDTVTLTHVVTGASEYADLEASDVTVNITENDQRSVTISATSLAIDEGNTGNYTVRLGTEPTGDVKITIGGVSGDVSVDETSLTFTTGNWNREQPVTVTVAADDDAVTDAAVTLTHTVSGADYQGVTAAAVTVRIRETGTASVTVSESTLTIQEGSSDDYTVVLTSQPTATVTVTVEGASGDVRVNGSSRASLAFTTKNWNTEQMVTVSVLHDDDAQDDVTQDDPVILKHRVRGGDYSGLYPSDSTVLDVTVTTTDDDEQGVTVNPMNLEVVEGQTVRYSIMLDTQPTETVTVTAEVSSGGVTLGNRTATSTTLSFTRRNWSGSRTVTVYGNSAGAATLTHSVSGGDYGTVTVEAVDVDVKAADSPGVVVDPTDLSVREGRSATYTVRLTKRPTDTVTITVTGAQDGVTVSSETLTFTTTGSTSRTVTVRAAEDDNTVDESVTLQHAVSGGDYNNESASSVEVMVMDNDQRV